MGRPSAHPIHDGQTSNLSHTTQIQVLRAVASHHAMVDRFFLFLYYNLAFLGDSVI
jgi:hypothetical protein